MTAYAGRSVRRFSHGFTLLEMAIVTILFALLGGGLLHYLRSYQAQIERLAVQQTVHAIRSEMALRIGHLIITHRSREIGALARENPMDWLAQKPANYLGEFYAPKTTKIASGNWYFDKSSLTLVYLLNHEALFQDDSSKQLNFRTKLVNNNQNADGKLVSMERTMSMLDFVQVSP
jgi:prepilin-type N-terminal cleavage/methylation domain-containing protein